jgi:hypothetical protein
MDGRMTDPGKANSAGNELRNYYVLKFTCSNAIEFRQICWTPKRLMDFMSAKA